MRNNKDVKTNGWVIVSDDGYILDFTFTYYRTDSINKFCDLFSKKWKHHYYKGYRCVKAVMVIKIEKNDN